LNFDRDRPSAALPTVGGSIKGQHLNVPAWGYWSGAVGLHERAKMKRSPHSLISAYCVTSCRHGRTPASKLALNTCPQAVSRCVPPTVQYDGDGRVRR